MEVVNVSFCLNENSSSFEVMVPETIPIRQSPMRNNMSSELESTRNQGGRLELVKHVGLQRQQIGRLDA